MVVVRQIGGRIGVFVVWVEVEDIDEDDLIFGADYNVTGVNVSMGNVKSVQPFQSIHK